MPHIHAVAAPEGVRRSVGSCGRGCKAEVCERADRRDYRVFEVATMPLVKGLEFIAFAVVACDSGIIPSDNRLESVTEEADLEEIYATERQLL